MSWKQFVARHARGRSQADLALIADVSQGTVSRWLKGTQVAEAGAVIAFARAVSEQPLQALVEAGFLSPEEAGAAPSARADVSQLSNDELLELVRARMKREDGEGRADRPAANTPAGGSPAPIPLRPLSVVDETLPASEEAAAALEDPTIREEIEAQHDEP